jgi:hypothetical protein
LHRKRPAELLRAAAAGHSTTSLIPPHQQGNGTGESRERQRCSTRVMERFADARSQPTQA